MQETATIKLYCDSFQKNFRGCCWTKQDWYSIIIRDSMPLAGERSGRKNKSKLFVGDVDTLGGANIIT